MATIDFYADRRWCRNCRAYVPYLLSPNEAWCTRCGSPVALFSEEDRAQFERGLCTEAEEAFDREPRGRERA